MPRPRKISRGTPAVYRLGHLLAGCRWADTGNLLSEEPRGCLRCEKPPTVDGHDPCIANLRNVSAACCGHGVETPYLVAGPLPATADRTFTGAVAHRLMQALGGSPPPFPA